MDWNSLPVIIEFTGARHSPRGSVDWNNRRNHDWKWTDWVTPLVGVWIEIIRNLQKELEKYVTPLVGVWIEIAMLLEWLKVRGSHSPRGSVDWNKKNMRLYYPMYRHSPRGSVDWNWWKGNLGCRSKYRHSPRGSVDWNSLLAIPPFLISGSLPSWECGLKLLRILGCSNPPVSLPSWECGLKFPLSLGAGNFENVTPLVGVWIEIVTLALNLNSFVSLPSWECGLKLTSQAHILYAYTSLPSWECGLKYGELYHILNLGTVTPLVGVWIEI